ncbi:hypothetical protein F01_90046 [Burkholderia cenocepacia]|nr:hypothetical protein F01_90046 [Burkholderia cenocepacia]
MRADSAGAATAHRIALSRRFPF